MEGLVNRILKNNRQLSKWAKRAQITCYRVYDHDMPEYPFCVDIYADNLYVSEYVFRTKLNEVDYEIWLEACLDAMATALKIEKDHVFFKRRKRLDHRNEQYEKVATVGHKIVLEECGLKFWINLVDYLDTGLFLDHRPLRQVVRAEAAGKKVLNLFAYTGSFSVYAAAGGAEQVTTVDLSNTYLNWAKENLILNDLFEVSKHQFVAADIMTFLKETPTVLYDIVIVDPPSFSNSKKMKGTWDVQRDHPALLHYLLKHVAPGGKIYFSNNFRNFKPDFSRLNVKETKDITLKTIPEDFRNKNIHHCFEITKS